jgi:RNA polymerase sporulation-specific sigma factor
VTPSTCPADDDLVTAARDGDETAFRALVDRFRPMVRGMAGDRYLPGGDLDDLVQEGMIGLWHALRDHDAERGPFAPFARLCVDRRMWAAVTRANRHRHRLLQDAAPVDGCLEMPDLHPDPADLACAHDAIRGLGAHVRATLSDLEQDVLALYAAGESYDAIAQVLEVHRKGIDNALQRARRKVSAYRQAELV